MKGETNFEPFFAGRMACAGEKMRVTFVRMPSRSSCRAAVMPSGVAGILMTKFSLMAAILRAAAIISGAASIWGSISTETGKRSQPERPSAFTQSAISRTAVRKGLPLSMIWRGFVVTPSMPKVLCACAISSSFALSRKYFMCSVLSLFIG